DHKGSKKERANVFTGGTYGAQGPAVAPKGLEATGDVSFGLLPSGYGYIHVRRCKGDLPERIDEALAKVGKAKGLIVDFRANSGGGFDHEALLGRFLLPDETLGQYKSAGPNPYGGPVVVIVDSGVVTAGETGSGIFKEDGRAY